MKMTAEYRYIWLEKAFEATRMKYQQVVYRDWVSHIARPARYFFQFGIPSPAIARMLVDVASKIGLSIRKKFEGDAEKQAILLSSLHKLTFYGMEIVLSEITQLERRQAEDERGKIGEAFRTEVAGQLDVALSDSAKLDRKSKRLNSSH